LPQHLNYRQSFKWIQRDFPDAPLYFYTDTPQLSAQYKVLSDLDFKPLPVPVPWDASSNVQTAGGQNKPITIAYVGDVRDEKGYQFYPALVQGLWSDYLRTGKVRFCLQSNFADNLAVSRESAVAQSFLRSLPDTMVRHVKGPLDSAGYKALIDEADIILLTYKPEHYMARSSGIFIEALKAGKAVLMPSTTWMQAEIEEMRQNKWRAALKAASFMPSLMAGDRWREGEKLMIAQGTRCVITDFTLSYPVKETMYIECTVQCSLNDKTQEVSGVVQVMDGESACCLLSIPEGADDIYITYRFIGGVDVMLQCATLHVSAAPWQGAQDFAAAIYPHQNAQDMLRHMRELIDNIDEYKRDAVSFAQTRGGYFTPETLVARIVEEAIKTEGKLAA